MRTKNILYFLLIFIGFNLHSQDEILFNETPPNGVFISDNFYCDQTEITNFNWIEYMHWTRKVYGMESTEYLEILPDTSSWGAFECRDPYKSYYLRHPAYRNYPVLGISQKQAKSFSNWRSDRVMEFLLIREDILEFDTLQTAENHFTIERYLSGKHKGMTPDPRIKSYPYFRLPTKIEFSKLVNFQDSLESIYLQKCRGKKCKEYKESYPFIVSNTDSCDVDLTWPVESGGFNSKKTILYHLRGNAAEWMNEENVILGGSWLDPKSTILSEDGNSINDYGKLIDETDVSIGFRNVFEWRDLKSYPK